MQRRSFCTAVAAAAAFPFGSHGQTGTWPQRPVRWILSQPAGAGPDILARYIADQLSRTWSHPVIIENRPGGQNVIGAQAAARSAPDGHTFYFATTAAMVTNVFTFKSLPYDPAKDFVPVRLVGRSPFVIAAGATAPVRDLAELIALARNQPGKIAIATEGPKTFSGMLAGTFAQTAGIQLNHVPYQKAGDAIQDVIGGRVELICLPDAALTAHVKSGKIRALATSSAQRQADMPQVPSLSEFFKGLEFTGWNGLFAPAGTPADVVTRLNQEVEAVVRRPEVAERMLALGSLVESRMTVAEFDAFMASERERWAALVKTLNIQPE